MRCASCRRDRPAASISAAATAPANLRCWRPSRPRCGSAPFTGRRRIGWPSSSPAAGGPAVSEAVVPVDGEGDDDDAVVVVADTMEKKLGFSTGERQLKSLEEIVDSTDARVYLLDEWDANLDAANKAKADALIDALAARARVVEISHRDHAA